MDEDLDWGPPVSHADASLYKMERCKCCGDDTPGMFIDDVSDVFVGCTTCHYRSISVPGGYDCYAIIHWNENKRNYFMSTTETKPLPPEGNFFGMGNMWGVASRINKGTMIGTLNGKNIKSVDTPPTIVLDTISMNVHLDDGSSVVLSNAQLKKIVSSNDNNTFVLPVLRDQDIFEESATPETLTISYKDITQ